ncbi:MAG: YCF48-related protein [Ignavibacteria bacterium]
MKTKTTFLAVILFIAANVFAQSWTWQYPYPNANSLLSSYFFNESTGYFGGDFGTLLKTTNGGANISIQNTGNNYNVNSINFINSTTGFIGAGFNDKVIMKTTNGGLNWAVTNLGTPFAIKKIKFINANSGIAISSYQGIYYTTNGGTNWTNVNGIAQSLYGLDYVTPNLAYVCSYGGTIQKTTNGGLNWTSQLIASTTATLFDVQFTDSLTGYVCGTNSLVLKTTNGGLNWANVNAPNFYTIYSMSFYNALNGTAVCENGEFLKTTNGGTNWTFQVPPPANANRLSAVKYFPSGTIYASGLYGSNMKSTDAGITWNSLITGRNTYIFSSWFLNANTGFASMNGGIILKTTNGGTNWVENLTPTSGNNITGIQFIDANTGYAIPVFGNDQILKTTDAGNNWSVTVPGINNYVNNLCFLNASTGVLQTSFSTFRTTNGGTNWTFIDSVTTQLNGLQFVNSLTGYASTYVSPHTYFRKTTNGGLNWTTLPESVTNTYVISYKFYNGNTGYAAGGNNLYKTTNGGNTWALSTATGMSVQVVYLLDSVTVLLGGVFGEFRKSTDGGSSFTNVPFLSQNGITTMSFINPMTGWVMGQGGMIVKTSDLMTGNSEITSQTPGSFALSQNYPNPFNPSTVIRFELSVVSDVRIKVYDVTGREVQTLVNEKLQPGVYEKTFDGSKLTSGVYFYKITANDISETRRMLLIK